MATKLKWFKDRPFLLWLGMWSVYFEGMHLLWGAKGPNQRFFVFYLIAPLYTLLLCVRPAIARVLRVAYYVGFIVAFSISMRAFSDWPGAIGAGLFSAILMDFFVRFKMNGGKIKH